MITLNINLKIRLINSQFVIVFDVGYTIPSVTTQPARDIPGTSPKGSNIRDLQGTFRGLLGD